MAQGELKNCMLHFESVVQVFRIHMNWFEPVHKPISCLRQTIKQGRTQLCNKVSGTNRAVWTNYWKGLTSWNTKQKVIVWAKEGYCKGLQQHQETKTSLIELTILGGKHGNMHLAKIIGLITIRLHNRTYLIYMIWKCSRMMCPRHRSNLSLF